MRQPPFTALWLLAMGSALLPGCALLGPRDGYAQVSGQTPVEAAEPCLLSVSASGSPHPPRQRPVSGTFHEGFVIGPSRRGHDVTLVCDGKAVTVRHFKYGSDMRINDTVAL